MWDLMDAIWKTLNYLANLQWTEKKQHDCLFCNETNFNAIVYKVSAQPFTSEEEEEEEK